MLNVLHLINYPGKGGTEKYIVSLTEKLHNKKCRFYLCYSEEGPMLEEMKNLGVEISNINMKSSYDFKAAKALKNLCKELSIDIIHTHFLRENCIAALSKILGNKVIIVRTHHIISDDNVCVRLFNSFLTAFTDRIIAVSTAVKKRMAPESINSEKIEVIHNGIDTEYWSGEHNYKIKEEFGLDRRSFLITSVARFSEEKGHIFFLESIKQFIKLYNKDDINGSALIKFLLVGDGDMLDSCIKFAEMLGISRYIIFAGFRIDIKEILNGSDLFVSHSKSEALGISILEALACEVPIISTDAGGPAEIIGENNEFGTIVEYGDIEGMANAIMRMMSDKEYYNNCKINARNIVCERFNLDIMAEKVYSLYMQSLSSGNA